MREQYFIDVLNRFDTDEIYARELCDFPTKGELTVHDKAVLEHDKIPIRERIVNELHLIQKWNHKKESGVPPRFAECSFFNFECRTENEKHIFQKVCDFVNQEHNEGVLLMTGAKGTGKTHLGTAAVRDTQGRYVSMEDLIYKVESSMNFKSPQTEEEVFADYSTTKFLVIDEVGRSLKREKEIEILSYILRKRYDNQLPTIVISNLEKKVLMKNLGEAVVDRLRETATSIEFTGESYRILKRKVA